MEVRGERPPCARCGEALGGQTTEALGLSFHTTCFTCYMCRRDLSQPSVGRILAIGGQPHCGLCGKKTVLGTLTGKLSSPEMDEQRQKEVAAQQEVVFQAKQDALLRGEHQTLGDPRKDRARGAGGRRPPTRAPGAAAARTRKTLTTSTPAPATARPTSILALTSSEPAPAFVSTFIQPSPATSTDSPSSTSSAANIFTAPLKVTRSAPSNRAPNPFTVPFNSTLQTPGVVLPPPALNLFSAIPDDPDFNFFGPTTTTTTTPPAAQQMPMQSPSYFGSNPFGAPATPFGMQGMAQPDFASLTQQQQQQQEPQFGDFVSSSSSSSVLQMPPPPTPPGGGGGGGGGVGVSPRIGMGAPAPGFAMPAPGSFPNLRRVSAPPPKEPTPAAAPVMPTLRSVGAPTPKEPAQSTAPVMPTLRSVAAAAPAANNKEPAQPAGIVMPTLRPVSATLRPTPPPSEQPQPQVPLVKLRPVTAGPMAPQTAAAPAPAVPMATPPVVMPTFEQQQQAMMFGQFQQASAPSPAPAPGAGGMFYQPAAGSMYGQPTAMPMAYQPTAAPLFTQPTTTQHIAGLMYPQPPPSSSSAPTAGAGAPMMAFQPVAGVEGGPQMYGQPARGSMYGHSPAAAMAYQQQQMGAPLFAQLASTPIAPTPSVPATAHHAAPPPSRPPRASMATAPISQQPSAAEMPVAHPPSHAQAAASPSSSSSSSSSFSYSSSSSSSSAAPPPRRPRTLTLSDDDIPVSREVATILNQNTITDVSNYTWEERWSMSWSGYLNKLDSANSISQSFGKGLWRKRWFLLRENIFVYYHQEMADVWAKDTPPSGFIDLREATVRPSEHPNGLEIINPERTWHLEAKTRSQMGEVLHAIDQVQRHFASVPLVLPSSPLHGKELFKAGYLERRTNFGLSWTKNWIVLRAGSMYIQKNEHSKFVIVSMPLHNAQIVEYKMDKFPNAFEVKSHRGHTEIFNTDNDMALFEWVNAFIQQRVLIDEQMTSIVIS